MKFRNIFFFKHFMINDQYKLDIVDRFVNCKTIKCNYVHYFMIISNYLFFDLTISCIVWYQVDPAPNHFGPSRFGLTINITS